MLPKLFNNVIEVGIVTDCKEEQALKQDAIVVTAFKVAGRATDFKEEHT